MNQDSNNQTPEGILNKLDEWPRHIKGLDPEVELSYRASIAAKLCQCYEEIEAVYHDDTNQAHKYSFASAEIIYRACRRGMSKTRLAIVPFMGDFEEEPIVKGQGQSRSGAYMVVDFDFLLIDADTGYGIPIPWRGEVMEYGDKGFNKSATNATKYMLRTLFLLPTDKDEDVDSHSEEGRPARGGARAPQAPPAAAQSQRPQQTKPQAQQAKPKDQKPPRELTPEEKEYLAQRNENLAAAYPNISDADHPENAAQRAQLQEFKDAAKNAGLQWADIVVNTGPKRSSHETFMRAVADHIAYSRQNAAPEPGKAQEAKEDAKTPQGTPQLEEERNIDKEVDELLKGIMRSSDKLALLDMASSLGMKVEDLAREAAIEFPQPSVADFQIYATSRLENLGGSY